MNDTIRVLPEQVLLTIELRRITALADCTAILSRDGRTTMTRNWPGLSSGEELLWGIAEAINGLRPMPPWQDVVDCLDSTNVAAVAGLLGREVLR